MPSTDPAHLVAALEHGLGRRRLLQAAAATGLGVTAAAVGAEQAHASHQLPRGLTEAPLAWRNPKGVLQPHRGPIKGQHYLASETDEVLWGYVPTVHATPVLSVRSGATVTIDALSHEGILEDQGRDPVAWFGSKGVPRAGVLRDAVDVAAHYDRTPRSFDKDGPHVVTGPIAVAGAEPGDVLKIEPLHLLPRVPYGVVSSRHGKGALAVKADGTAPAGISLAEVMPPRATDGRASGDPTRYGNVSAFTGIERGKAVMRSGSRSIRFPLNYFFGMMGVAYADANGLTDPLANSVPPTLGGGNIDIRQLGVGSTFYLPVRAPGGLFYVGDPHMAMGSGEVALTAMEGSLRGTFRLTVCKKGSGDAPAVAHRYPWAETRDHWLPIGLSDPDGSGGGINDSDLDVAMRRAVVNALDFLEQEQGIDRAVAYAYLSAASDFVVSQVVDRTTGVHGLISKADFR
ncbi:acetamidase/formamidase family protein [Arsenicicoccus bolidensis]|uniref:acetamidase/formamidase family protein n=1 Tax=Arsenicicoccus bolidensis TaxID=229480 RepID=UPI00041876E0|nr:acetamidase/formamidase family protein [Arsenicicoccus bolidensis]